MRWKLDDIAFLLAMMCFAALGGYAIGVGNGYSKAYDRYSEKLEETGVCGMCAEPDILQDPSVSERRDSVVATEARRWHIPVDLALAIARVENYSGDSTARSPAGAIGIMQVMPFWGPGGKYDLSGACIQRVGPAWSWPTRETRSLTDMQLNACIAMQVLRDNYLQHGNWNGALRAYNGAKTQWKGDLYVSQIVERLNFGTPLEGAL